MTAHTDHPARHWDRTCPACIADRAGLVAVLLFGAAWIFKGRAA